MPACTTVKLVSHKLHSNKGDITQQQRVVTLQQREVTQQVLVINNIHLFNIMIFMTLVIFP